MIIKIDCDSPLIQKSLQSFLSNYDLSNDNFDIILTDKKELKEDKPIFLIAKKGEISIPFSKEELELKLNDFFINSTKKEFSLEKEVDNLVEEFKQNLIKVIRKYAK